MNMLEALQVIWTQKETMVARPNSWAGRGVGFLVINDIFVIATKDGLAMAPIPGSETFTEWHTMTIDALESEVQAIEAIDKTLENRAPEVAPETPSAPITPVAPVDPTAPPTDPSDPSLP